MTCEFSSPVNHLGQLPEAGEVWNFEKIDCEPATTTARFEILEMAGEDYLLFDRSLSITDVLITSFFLFLILALIFSFVFRLVYPFYFRYINKKYKF